MQKIVPLISSSLSGPLDIVHLPRLWLRLSLEAQDKLPESYRNHNIDKVFDEMVIKAIGINIDELRKFIAESRPTYPQLEAWIEKQPGVKLDLNTTLKLNAAIRSHTRDIKSVERILDANKMSFKGFPIHSVKLGNLEDWLEFHRALYNPGTPTQPSMDREFNPNGLRDVQGAPDSD